jgi:2-dehydropantoate 2-reductase
VTSFAVLGPGGVGGFVAAALARAGAQVTVVAREPTAAVIARDGIAVDSVLLGRFAARPDVVSRLTDAVDVLFVATKATGLADALERVAAPPALALPLLNGLDQMRVLRERFGRERVAAGVIRIESDRPAPGQIVQSSPRARVDLAADEARPAAVLAGIVAALERAGIPARVGPSEAQVLWSKLVRLNALSATTTVSGRTIGTIRSDPEWRLQLVDCIGEAAAAASADGAEIDPAATLAELDGAHPGLGSSMQRDLAAGRIPELDAIQGSVIRAAARHGLECPTVRRLAAEIARLAGIAAPAGDA